MSQELKEFTREELCEYNGQDGKPAYLAYDGKVYDVSPSKFWPKGAHMRQHHSGDDLTTVLCGAPHGDEVFERLTQVGTLKPERDPMDAHLLDSLLALFDKIPFLRRHPHPMTVHFPLAFVLVVPLFNILYLLTGYGSFETTAFHCLVLSVLATIVALTTGPYAWWVNYGAKLSTNIKVKLGFSVLLLALVAIALAWRVANPAILLEADGARLFYVLLSVAFVPCVSVLGWFGAKMTFPH